MLPNPELANRYPQAIFKLTYTQVDALKLVQAALSVLSVLAGTAVTPGLITRVSPRSVQKMCYIAQRWLRREAPVPGDLYVATSGPAVATKIPLRVPP